MHERSKSGVQVQVYDLWTFFLMKGAARDRERPEAHALFCTQNQHDLFAFLRLARRGALPSGCKQETNTGGDNSGGGLLKAMIGCNFVMARPAAGRIGEWTGLDPPECFGVSLFRHEIVGYHNETCLIPGRRDPNPHCDSISKM